MKNKKIYLEILRIIACFFVIARHTNSFILQIESQNSITWLLAVGYHILSMTCVPIFFMISGSLLLTKEKTYKEMIKKTITRLLLPMLFFSLIIHLKRNPVVDFKNLISFIELFCKNEILSTYWYIYALMGLYLATPFLQKLCKNMKDKDYNVFILYTLVLISIIPILKRYQIIVLAPEFTIPLISTYVAYFIIGNYILNADIKTTKKQENIMVSIIMSILLFGVLMTYLDHKYFDFNDYYFSSMNIITVFIPSILIAYLTRKKLEKFQFSSTIENMIINIGSKTFGIYLIHALFIDNFKFIYDGLIDIFYVTPFISLIIYQVFLFIITTIIIQIMQKIPIIKNLV